jgi:predicted AAA+ superfamily ATPase
VDVARPFWVARIEAALARAPIAWLSGVRRVGKTTLARQLQGAELLNCDLPSVAELARDPEHLLRSVDTRVLVLDEVHQLDDPSRLLKIAADEHPRLRVVATGSSTLAATRKFRDSLAGRRRTVTLMPVLASELAAFGVTSLDRRLLHGGLPEALRAPRPPADLFSEWLDSYFARDVQELFRLEKRGPFLRFVELVLRQSGGMVEVTSLAKHTGVTRPTIGTWLDVLDTTHVARRIRPYHAGSRREILAQPKLYAFDTGFVAWARGYGDLRPDDRGPLLEHLVLDELHAAGHFDRLRFWRDKQQREIDFVIDRGRAGADAIECKWSPDAFEPRNLLAFREHAARGRNFVVSGTLARPSTRRVAGHEVHFTTPARIAEDLEVRAAGPRG